jgi:hypothetical protein
MEVMSLKKKLRLTNRFKGTAPLTAEEHAKFYSGNLKEIRVLQGPRFCLKDNVEIITV